MNNLEFNDIVTIFKSIITGLLRTSMTRLRRVIFSKNNDGIYYNNKKFILYFVFLILEFCDIIKEALLKNIGRQNLILKLNKVKTESSGKYAVLEKMVCVLVALPEEKIQMIYQVIKIITNLNGTKADTSNLIELDKIDGVSNNRSHSNDSNSIQPRSINSNEDHKGNSIVI
jgi:hypothetical protein